MAKNLVELEGNLTKDVELKGDADKNYCFFNVAVGRTFGEGADFVSVKAFKDLAKSICNMLKKGDSINLIGHISTGSYMKDKVKLYTMDIVADKVRKLAKSGGAQSSVEVESK